MHVQKSGSSRTSRLSCLYVYFCYLRPGTRIAMCNLRTAFILDCAPSVALSCCLETLLRRLHDERVRTSLQTTFCFLAERWNQRPKPVPHL
jgi:hypothetical protein